MPNPSPLQSNYNEDVFLNQKDPYPFFNIAGSNRGPLHAGYTLTSVKTGGYLLNNPDGQLDFVVHADPNGVEPAHEELTNTNALFDWLMIQNNADDTQLYRREKQFSWGYFSGDVIALNNGTFIGAVTNYSVRTDPSADVVCFDTEDIVRRSYQDCASSISIPYYSDSPFDSSVLNSQTVHKISEDHFAVLFQFDGIQSNQHGYLRGSKLAIVDANTLSSNGLDQAWQDLEQSYLNQAKFIEFFPASGFRKYWPGHGALLKIVIRDADNDNPNSFDPLILHESVILIDSNGVQQQITSPFLDTSMVINQKDDRLIIFGRKANSNALHSAVYSSDTQSFGQSTIVVSDYQEYQVYRGYPERQQLDPALAVAKEDGSINIVYKPMHASDTQRQLLRLHLDAFGRPIDGESPVVLWTQAMPEQNRFPKSTTCYVLGDCVEPITASAFESFPGGDAMTIISHPLKTRTLITATNADYLANNDSPYLPTGIGELAPALRELTDYAIPPVTTTTLPPTTTTTVPPTTTTTLPPTTTTTVPLPTHTNRFIDEPVMQGDNAGAIELSTGEFIIRSKQGKMQRFKTDGERRRGVFDIYRDEPSYDADVIPTYGRKPDHLVIAKADGLGAISLHRINTGGTVMSHVQRLIPPKNTFYSNPKIALSYKEPNSGKSVSGMMVFSVEHPHNRAEGQYSLMLQRINETPKPVKDPIILADSDQPLDANIMRRPHRLGGYFISWLNATGTQATANMQLVTEKAVIDEATKFTSESFELSVDTKAPEMISSGLTKPINILAWKYKTSLDKENVATVILNHKLIVTSPVKPLNELSKYGLKTHENILEFAIAPEVLPYKNYSAFIVQENSIPNQANWQVSLHFNETNDIWLAVLRDNLQNATDVHLDLLTNQLWIQSWTNDFTNAIHLTYMTSGVFHQSLSGGNKREIQEDAPVAPATTLLPAVTIPVTTTTPALTDASTAQTAAAETSSFTPQNVENAFNQAGGQVMLAQWAVGMYGKAKQAVSSWWSTGPSIEELTADINQLEQDIAAQKQAFLAAKVPTKSKYDDLRTERADNLALVRKLTKAMHAIRGKLNDDNPDLKGLQVQLNQLRDNPDGNDLDMLSHAAKAFVEDVAALQAAQTQQQQPQPAAMQAAVQYRQALYLAAGAGQHQAALPGSQHRPAVAPGR